MSVQPKCTNCAPPCSPAGRSPWQRRKNCASCPMRKAWLGSTVGCGRCRKTSWRPGGIRRCAGIARDGFHTWPSGHIPQDTAPKPLLRIRPPAKKTFGEAFGAATGVSEPRLQKIRIRNDYAEKFTSRRGQMERRRFRFHVLMRLQHPEFQHSAFSFQLLPSAWPFRGITCQRRVPTLGIRREKQTRLLKERRLFSCLGPRARSPLMRCSFRTHQFSRMRFPGRCPGLICDAPSGQRLLPLNDFIPGLQRLAGRQRGGIDPGNGLVFFDCLANFNLFGDDKVAAAHGIRLA